MILYKNLNTFFTIYLPRPRRVMIYAYIHSLQNAIFNNFALYRRDRDDYFRNRPKDDYFFRNRHSPYIGTSKNIRKILQPLDFC